MIRRPPRSTRTDTLVPYTTLFRSWAGQGLLHQFDQGLSVGAALDVIEDRGEFIAAEACDRVRRAQHAAKPRRDRFQLHIASAVAVAVIDRLEAVDVDVDQRRCVDSRRARISPVVSERKSTSLNSMH